MIASCNVFEETMFTNQRVRMIKQKITQHHGRIENIVLFDNAPKEEDLANLVLAKQQMKQNEEIRAICKAMDEDDSWQTKVDDDDDGAAAKKKRVKPKEIEVVHCAVKQYEDDTAYIYEVFPETKNDETFYYGFADKKTACLPENTKTVYYNFVPHDKNDPMLLALFTHGQE